MSYRLSFVHDEEPLFVQRFLEYQMELRQLSLVGLAVDP